MLLIRSSNKADDGQVFGPQFVPSSRLAIGGYAHPNGRRITVNNRIERLRRALLKQFARTGNLLDPAVLAVSQQLDQAIVQEQRIRTEGMSDPSV